MKHILWPFLLAACVAGCSSADTTPPDTTTTGSISGVLRLYNNSGVLLADHSGATATIEGTSISGTTDANGAWTVRNVALPGTYSFDYTKTGYALSRDLNIYFPQGTSDTLHGLPYLYPLNTNAAVHLDSISVTGSAGHTYIIWGGVSGMNAFSFVYYAVGRSAASAISSPILSNWYDAYHHVPPLGTAASVISTLTDSLLTANGAHTGDTLFAVARIFSLGHNALHGPCTQCDFDNAGPYATTIKFVAR